MSGLVKKLNNLKAFRGLNEREFSWVLYDVGNSAYTMLACSLIPIWFKTLAIGNEAGKLSSDDATAVYSLSISIVTIIVALLGPVCGAIADRKDTKKLIFSSAVALGVIGCCISGFSFNWIAFILICSITKIFYNASLVFYDSMLNDVTVEDRMDEVSAYGYAWGYIGSCIPFILALIAYVCGPDMLGLISNRLSMNIGFIVTGIWWLLVSVPLFKNYKQKNYVEKQPHMVLKAFKDIFNTVKSIIVKDKKVGLFLLAFFMYIDGVGTIIDNCINIGTDLGLPVVGQVVVLLLTQVVAFGGSLVFAKLSKKYDTTTLIKVCIIGYFFICLYAITLRNLVGFGILAFAIGCFQGSIQSLSRSYFSKIIPAEKSGEYFGIYDIFAKGASFLGSLVIAGVKFYGGTSNVAIAALAVFFIIGFIFMKISEGYKIERD